MILASVSAWLVIRAIYESRLELVCYSAISTIMYVIGSWTPFGVQKLSKADTALKRPPCTFPALIVESRPPPDAASQQTNIHCSFLADSSVNVGNI